MSESNTAGISGSGASWDWIWKVVVWGAPLIAAAGSAWWQLADLRGDLARIEAQVGVVAVELRTHEAAPGHYDSQARLGTLERTLDALQAEQKRTSENLAAICQVTGARCR